MKFRLLGLLLVIVGVWSCQSDGGSGNPTLPSGYEYILHTPDNTGRPTEVDALAFMRVGLRNGETLVNSNYDSPFPQMQAIPNPVEGQVLPPWVEALMIMKEGDSLTIIVPLDTIPVEQRPQGFETAENLFYDISLKEIKLKADVDAEVKSKEEITNANIDAYNAGTIEGLQTTESGLKYVILEEGTGETPVVGDFVYVNYFGSLTTNKFNFDNSFKRGTPFPFQLGKGQVIRGWDEGIALLPVGSEAVFFIPAELGYGEGGSPPVIPANAELAFYVQLISKVAPE